MKDFLKGVWTILRREVAAQFSSPMAYIFLVVFLTVSTGLFLFLGAFFAYPTAEMGRYFGFLIPVLCIFAPAATMRIWAEDRKENTIEMLLTFPISAPALVLGKFLAAFVFYLSALAGTFMIPVMLAWLGEPDWGPIVSGYLGAMLVGALFVALGMFVSGFCRDQVTAFVLSFLACGVISLVGWGNFAMIMEGSLGGFGAFIRVVFGMTGHYEPFVIGKVVIADILYFLGWTALFLFLNGVYLEGRNRPRAGLMFSGLVALAVVVGGLFNWAVTDWNLGRIDMTEGNIYSVSEATTRILGRLKTNVNVNVYISPASKMPPAMRNLERDIMAKLDEMRAASGGMLVPAVKHMHAAKQFEGLRDEEKEEPVDEKEKKKKSIEARLREKGVKPFAVGTFEADEQRTALVYSSIGVAYKEKKEEIIAGILPDNMPEGNLSQLEYNLMNVIYRMTREEPPTVALFAAIEEINIPPQMLMQWRMQGRPVPQPVDRYEFLQPILSHGKFDVRRVKLQKGDGMPDKYDVLAVVEPKDFGERHRWEIARALRSGKSVFLAVQNERWDYSVRGTAKAVNKRELKPGINELLSEYGLAVDTATLMDTNSGTLTMTQRVQNPRNFQEALMGRRVPFDLPMHVVVKSDSINRDVSITNNLGDLLYLWGSRIKVNQEKLDERKLEVTTLFTSSDEAWTAPTESSLREQDIRQPADTSRVPLAVLVRGRLDKDGKRELFPDVHAGKERPEWPDKPPQPGMRPPPPEEEGPAGPVEPAPGKLILVGCAEMFTKGAISRPGHMDFFMNCVEALTFGDDLIQIRAKKPIPRTIDKPSDFSRGLWKVLEMGLMSAVVIAAGILRMVMVARSRARYRASLSKAA